MESMDQEEKPRKRSRRNRVKKEDYFEDFNRKILGIYIAEGNILNKPILKAKAHYIAGNASSIESAK